MTEVITVEEYRKITSEHKLQVLVLDILAIKKSHPDIFGFAIPNAAKRSARWGARMKQEGLLPGVADLCIMQPCNRVAWLELKNAKGRQSREQRAFEARCLRLGHPYAMAKTLPEAVSFLRKVGAIK